ncbi:hypothetical protein [Endozoicomonas acroporae]|uniref:hypothetical protein n=1 Tax=Endozoicomonas acroporae TaxID=1701104 RepID=UPI003D7C025B
MISQPAVQSTGAPMASGSVPVQPTENWGLLAGVKVATWDIPILFLRSLHPGYIPPGTQPSAQPDEGPAFTFGSPDGQDSSFFQGVELAARLVSPYTVLPAEIRTMLEGIVTFSAATRFRDLLGAFGATEDSPPTENRADISEDGSPTNDKGRKKKKSQQTRQRTSPPATTSIGTGQLPKTAVALGALSSLSAAAAASSSGSNKEVPTLVPNATILGKIGDPKYPRYSLNGTYRQTADITVTPSFRSIGNKTHAFTGKYDGQGYTIRGLRQCLMENLEGEVLKLRFINPDIQTRGRTASIGVAACKMSGANAKIRGIYVEGSVLVTEGKNASAGIAVGEVKGGAVIKTTAVNCNVTTSGRSAYAGIGAGYVRNGKVKSTTAKNCNVTTSGSSAYAGIGAGYLHNGGMVDHTNAINCKVHTTISDAGIGVGRVNVNKGSVFNTNATDCKVETAGGNAGIGAGRVDKGKSKVSVIRDKKRESIVRSTKATSCEVETSRGNAGIGAGRVDDRKGVDKTEAVNCNVTKRQSSSNANIGIGIGVGSGKASNTKAMNCRIKASGNENNAGIGAGLGEANITLAIKCEVENSGSNGNIGIGVGYGYANVTKALNCDVKNFGPSVSTAGIGAGIGAGMGAADNTIAINCTVETSGDFTASGIGAGRVAEYIEHSTVNNTKSFNSMVKASASGFAGFGVGFGTGSVFNTMAVNSTVEGGAASNYFGAGRNPTFCNIRVNNQSRENIPRSFEKCDDSNFCIDIDDDHLPSLVKQDCQPTDCYSSALSSGTVSGSFIQYCPSEEQPKTIPTTTSTHTPTSRPTPPTTVVKTTPAPVPPASNTTISLPGATMTLPTSAAPLAATLSTGAIAGIAAAASVVLAGVVGGYIYRHCCRRSSPDAAGGWQELGAVNKAGQAQEAVDQPMMLLEEPGDKWGHQHGHIYEEIDIYNPRRMRTARAPDY